MAKKTATKAKTHAAPKTQATAKKAVAAQPKARASVAAPVHVEVVLADDAKFAYEHFLPTAMALPSASLLTYKAADPALALTNVNVGLAALLPQRAYLAEHLPRLAFSHFDSMPVLALAVQYAARQAEVAPSSGEIAASLSAAHALRTTLLAIADGLVHAGLLSGPEIAKIRKGSGPRDAAADCVDLADLFGKNEKRIAGKHAATADMLKSARQVGSYLLANLKSTRGKDRKAVNGPATEARDRLWSLLQMRHREMRRAAYYIWDEAFGDHVPSLLSHKRTTKPVAKAPAKSNGAPSASP